MWSGKNGKRWTLVVALCGIGIAAQACGPASRVRAIDAHNAAAMNGGSIPPTRDVQQANPALLGTFNFTKIQCARPGGEFPFPLMAEQASETLTIAPTSFHRVTTYQYGCVTQESFEIIGVDNRVLVIGNRTAEVFLDGERDTSGACDGLLASSSSGMFRYEYTLTDGTLVLQTNPVASCQQDEKTESVYQRM